MQQYSRYMLILLLLHKCLGQDDEDQVIDRKTKNAVDELLKKINEVSMQPFLHAPYGAKLQMLQKVEAKLKKATKALGSKGERYVKLIMEGIKEKALNDISDINKTQVEVPSNIANVYEFIKKTNITNDIHKFKISTKLHDEKFYVSRTPKNIELNLGNEVSIDESQNPPLSLSEQLRRMNSKSDDKHSDGKSFNQQISTERFVQSWTPRYECDGNLDKICLNLKQMKELKCLFDDSVISLDKLCNDVIDCIDRTDEKFCTSQVTERIHNAIQVIRQIDESFQIDCFPNKSQNSVMTSEIIILRSVLEAQQEFVQKYKHFNLSLIADSKSLNEEGTVKRAVNEISLIISSLALALDAELCSQRIQTGEEVVARKFNDLLIEDFDKIMEEVESPSKSCICKGEHCENSTTCTNTCKRICWQKHSLTRWRCPSINETENVPMSVICDGKFDCFDQSDEKDCVTGKTFAKFEAHNIFKEILTSLSVKATSKEYEYIRNMLLSLHSTVEELQKFCMVSEPDLKIIKALRNDFFSALSSIYSETVIKATFLYQKSEIYVFLTSLNENIINALKRSHTGNKRIISNDGCFCRDGQCSMPVCSRICRRSCVAEPWLTRYMCENSLNKSISLDNVCDGKPNCPKKDDEIQCEKEICRRHHLTLLRHDIQKIGKKQEGTSMGELLASWKIKVQSTLLVAESQYKPSPRSIRDVVRDILNDLVVTYGAVKDYRRNNEYALQEFISIARYIMKFLKVCSY